MGMRAENLRAFRTDRPAAKCGSFGGTRNDADVPGHTLILRKIVSVTVRELAESTGLKGRGTVAVRKVSRYWFRRNCGFRMPPDIERLAPVAMFLVLFAVG
jgi:hypothetical protein